MVSPELLDECALFDALTGSQRQAVAALADEVVCRPGEALFHEGHSASTLFFLLEGEVDLFHNVKGEDESNVRAAEALVRMLKDSAVDAVLEGEVWLYREVLVGHVSRPGDLIGISALTDPSRLTATTRARRVSRLLKVDAVALRRQCETDRELAYHLIYATARTAMERLHIARVQLTDARV